MELFVELKMTGIDRDRKDWLSCTGVGEDILVDQEMALGQLLVGAPEGQWP